MLRSDGGASTPGRTEKHRPCPWPSPWYGSWPRTSTFTWSYGVASQRGEDLLARRVDRTLLPLLLDELGELLEVGLLQLLAEDAAPGLGQHASVGHVNLPPVCGSVARLDRTYRRPLTTGLRAGAGHGLPAPELPRLPAGLPVQLPHRHDRRRVDRTFSAPAIVLARGHVQLALPQRQQPRVVDEDLLGLLELARPTAPRSLSWRDVGQQLVGDLGALVRGAERVLSRRRTARCSCRRRGSRGTSRGRRPGTRPCCSPPRRSSRGGP